MTAELDINIIRQVCNNGDIKWTTHTLERMQERNIEPTDVINCIMYGVIIEQYPHAYPYPACLILGTGVNANNIHIVLGYGNELIWIVTVYEPDENEWENEFTKRKDKTQ
ncbi:MAG: DUF4258 domain-containing protein [Oscillospiraceae bacterium]|jgi:hypothetical protein|nr:DUF4258 domain-containing protein [Oscillospiraceae bacterium]